MASKALSYGGSTLIVVMILSDLGFKLTPLLSAAGIVGIAIGFAAQTSLSNFISGIFLVWEKPFAVGDVIAVGDNMGMVLSIDLLSVKVRLFDNRFLRVPNSQLIQNSVINVTKYSIRRLDINLGVAYKEDIAKVRAILQDVADKNPFCLDEPAPLIIFQKYGDSALEFMLAVWCARTDFLALRNSIMEQIKVRFDEEGIEIPFPHRTLYAGEATKPIPVRMVEPIAPPGPAAEPGEKSSA
ncbi:MAG: mechanosensitive ion channel family protein [Puniceicoccaceae bacterium]|nr:MAG: mechanosensitive ion channel family protein [Puniceicoccaceae bacterium]